jgi:translation initiation factor IF-2/ribosome-binding factor A
MQLGVMATINQMIDQDTATLVVEELGHRVKLVSADALEENLTEDLAQHEGTPEPRAPVVTVMGHVDHGKTSLLDYIRKTKVASGEAGGITQHIGAYHVDTDRGMVSFLDTPGHAAFTAMRARGARSTDIVILVVAADDGVMPQTIEAIQHAKAAEVPLIVAVNKIDKEGADPDRVKNELAAQEVIPEEWGGDYQFVHVSAMTGDGIDTLLDAVLLQAELLELQAPRDVPAQGIVIESRLDKGRGPVASLLVQSGTLRQGDMVLAGLHYGRARAMLDEDGQPIEEAGPSIPVEILGLDGTPDAGDQFAVLESEKRARELADFRQEKMRENRIQRQQASKLDNMFESMTAGVRSTLNIVVKADVRGSLEALQSALMDLGNEEVQVNIVSGGVGGITETDINLAMTSEVRGVRFQRARGWCGAQARRAGRRGSSLLQRDLRSHRRRQAGPHGYAGTGDARGDSRYRRGARRVPLAEVRPHRRLHGDRGYGVPLAADPRPARQRRDLRGRTGVAAPLQGRCQRGAQRHGMRYRREELQRRQGRRSDRGLRSPRNRPQPLGRLRQMAREFSRPQRVADYLQRELATLIQRELRDPRLGMVSVTAVQVSRDLAHARVFFTLLGCDSAEEAQPSADVLNGAAGFLRNELSRDASMRSVPRLRFVFDSSVGRGRHLEALIEQARDADAHLHDGED